MYFCYLLLCQSEEDAIFHSSAQLTQARRTFQLSTTILTLVWLCRLQQLHFLPSYDCFSDDKQVNFPPLKTRYFQPSPLEKSNFSTEKFSPVLVFLISSEEKWRRKMFFSSSRSCADTHLGSWSATNTTQRHRHCRKNIFCVKNRKNIFFFLIRAVHTIRAKEGTRNNEFKITWQYIDMFFFGIFGVFQLFATVAATAMILKRTSGFSLVDFSLH